MAAKMRTSVSAIATLDVQLLMTMTEITPEQLGEL